MRKVGEDTNLGQKLVEVKDIFSEICEICEICGTKNKKRLVRTPTLDKTV